MSAKLGGLENFPITSGHKELKARKPTHSECSIVLY